MKALQNGKLQGAVAMVLLRGGILVTPLWVVFLAVVALRLFGVI